MFILKKLNPRRRHKRSRGNPISSSLPRHGARIRTKKHTAKQRETKETTKPKADYKLAQKIYRTKTIWCMNKLNDMMHVLKQWIKFNLSSNSQNGLEHRVSNKNLKKNENHLNVFKEIDQLIITQVRKQIRVINYINSTIQFHQF